jgi:hypothetical protein
MTDTITISNDVQIEIDGEKIISINEPICVTVDAYVTYTQEDGMPCEIDTKINGIKVENKPLTNWVTFKNSTLDEFDILFDEDEIYNDIHDYILSEVNYSTLSVSDKIEDGYISI